MARTRFQSPTAKEPQFCSFIFSRRPIWVFWRPKSPKRRLEKRFGGSIFSRRPILAFWPPKIQKERLERRFGGSTPGESWKMSIYKPKYGWVPLGKRIFSRTRQESSHQTFSQDALFGLFGGQKAQIGRLEKIEPPNLFSRYSFWTFWPPKSSNWTSWEKKNPQARFPAGLDSVGLIETLYDSFHLSE